MIQPPTEADYRRAGSALLAEAEAGDALDAADDPTEGGGNSARVVNAAVAANLLDDAALVLHVDGRDHAYRVPAVPFSPGARLFHFDALVQEGWDRLKAMADRDPHTNPEAEACLRGLALAYVEVAAIMWALVRPYRRRDRLRWRVGLRPKRNPFLELGFEDMHRALNFFFRARTSTRLMWLDSLRAPPSLTSTWRGTLAPTGPVISVPAGRTATR